MPIIRPKPVTGEIYHVYNRGVEKRDIFREEEDYYRFLHDLYEFNDSNPAFNITYFLEQQKRTIPNIAQVIRELQGDHKRDLLVEILCFCLMPNHFHLILRQIKDGGVSLFMKKIGSGFTGYINYKYKRVGPLFQGVYKLKHIPNDEYFLHCCAYVHRNPLELFEPNWKKEGYVKDVKGARKFLREEYRFSSFPDYVGIKNFPSITSREFLLNMYDNDAQAIEQFTLSWAAKDEEMIKHLAIDIDN